MALFGRKNADVASLLAAGDIKALRKLTTSTLGTARRGSKVGPISEQLSRLDITPLLEAMKSPDPSLRGAAADVLAHAKVPAAADALIEALDGDSDGDVRDRAARSLGYLDDPRGVAPLIAAMQNDSSKEVRGKAANALGKVGDARALAPLQAAKNDENDYVRTCARLALGFVADRVEKQQGVAASPEPSSASATRVAAGAPVMGPGDRRAYLILLWNTRPWSDAEAQQTISSKQEELGCPVELLERVQVQGAFPTEPDEFVVSTALLACSSRQIAFDSNRDRISLSGGKLAAEEGAGLITIEINR